MTLAEQRERLVEMMDIAYREKWREADMRGLPVTNKDIMTQVVRALSAAGFSIVADGAFDAFELAKVDLARKQE